jgi:hypothetical protein
MSSWTSSNDIQYFSNLKRLLILCCLDMVSLSGTWSEVLMGMSMRHDVNNVSFQSWDQNIRSNLENVGVGLSFEYVNFLSINGISVSCNS